MELRLKKETYREGDRVVVTDPDGGTFEGILKDILSTQIFVQGEETEKFFFTKQLIMRHAK